MYYIVVSEDCDGRQRLLGSFFSTERELAKKLMDNALLKAPEALRPFKVYLAHER